MKSWFAKLRISAALDGGRKLSASSRRGISGSDELRCFEEEMAALDRTLKETAPKMPALPAIHRSIMRAVQAAEHPAAAQRVPTFLRWLAAPAVALVALLVMWQAVRGPLSPPAHETQSLAVAASALEMGGQVARAVPSAVVGPLSVELDRLNRDLDSTAQFLLASLP
jgi:hypothetical protein